MSPVFWIGLGAVGFGFVTGLLAGSRSRDTRALTGALIGAYAGLMLAFPLLAIGLSTS